MNGVMETERLSFRPLRQEDLPALLPVYETNPVYMTLSEGAPGYTLEQLTQEWQEAAAEPDRTMLGIYRKEDDLTVGVADYLRRNPKDGMPWLGLLMVRGDLHRTGFGAEALQGLLTHFRLVEGWPAVRLGVISTNESALRFWERQGFVRYKSVLKQMPAGELEIICMERSTIP